MEEKNSIKQLLVLAILAGKIMLRNGAETYRVEDTIVRICKSRGVKFAQSFVTPTGIFLSVEYEGDVYSYIQRVKEIKIDLEKISLVNEFSRKFVSNNLSIDDSFEILNNINNINEYPKFIKYIVGSFSGGFYPLLIGSTYKEFIGAVIITFLILLLMDLIKFLNATYFIKNIIGGSVATLLSLIFVSFVINADVNKIIIGSIMPLVPGVAITNAVRDSLSGELVSGVARIMEAIIIAFGIAFGVGITLNLYIVLYGGF